MQGLRIDGRVSVVTGGARGIGRACAEALAANGSRIALCDLRIEDAESTAREIAQQAGVEARGYACDVSDPSAVNATIAAIAVDFGAIDHLVNNAGIQFVAPLPSFPDERWQRVRAIDLDAVFYVTKAVWPHLVARKRGRIVNIASVQGLIASPYKPAYIASKHGVVGLTKATAIEGAPEGITANAICPGVVMTDIIRGQAKDLAISYGGISEEEAIERGFLDKMPTRRIIETSEVGALCAYLCSDLARSITGAPIPIDGGWAAQ